MKVYCDLHIHSCLSPCGDDDMTPVNIVGFASCAGLDIIAIADHNAIGNVEVALRAGEQFGVIVVPAVELQTIEDIHILCLFRNIDSLKSFYNSVEFTTLLNRPDIYGNQYIMDDEDNVVAEHKQLLICASGIGIDEVKARVSEYNGLAIPAHIDRDCNGIISILGNLPDEFGLVEVSGDSNLMSNLPDGVSVISNSDSHTLLSIKRAKCIELNEKSIDGLFTYLEDLYERVVT